MKVPSKSRCISMTLRYISYTYNIKYIEIEYIIGYQMKKPLEPVNAIIFHSRL